MGFEVGVKFGWMAFGLGFLTAVHAGTPMETETATTLPRNTFEVSGALEYQTSSEGKEMAVPLAFEYGVLDNLEIMLEPTVYTSIMPNSGTESKGLGDVEITLNYNFLKDHGGVPALSVAGEVKIPTADDLNIGTTATDYAGYLAASKTLGTFTLHGNLSYTIVGAPKGTTLNNLYAVSAAVEQSLSPHWHWLAEVLANNTFAADTGGPENPLFPEASGGELTGTLGLRYLINPKLALSVGVTYDNNNAILIAPGLTCNFP